MAMTTSIVLLLLLGTLTICHGGYSGYSSSEQYGSGHRNVYGSDQGNNRGSVYGAGYGRNEQYGRGYEGDVKNKQYENNYNKGYVNNGYGKENKGRDQYNSDGYSKSGDQRKHGNGGQYIDGYGKVGGYKNGYGYGIGNGYDK